MPLLSLLPMAEARIWKPGDLVAEKYELQRPIARGGMGAAMPIRVMRGEHDEHAASLARIRALTGDLTTPPHACATWRALYDGLRTLEAELMEHIHLENNVLFPRAGRSAD